MKKCLMTIIFLTSILLGYSQDTMLAIIGKKVSVSTPPSSMPLIIDTLINTGFIDRGKKIDTILIIKIIDNINKATYKVSKLIKGNFEKDTVTFIFHDRNHVSSSNDVLLLLDKNNTHYVLKKQPIEVYNDKDNRWVFLYTAETNKYYQKFQKVKFKPELVFDVSMYNDEYIKKHYPSPYYKISKNKAFAVQGAYVEEFIE
jgi:hypothetical protein